VGLAVVHTTHPHPMLLKCLVFFHVTQLDIVHFINRAHNKGVKAIPLLAIRIGVYVMTKVKSVIAATVVPAVASIEICNVFDHSAIIKELADAESAQERMLILSKRTLGEVAAVGGRVSGIGESVNETLNLKIVERHGADWVKVYNTTTATLSDADKTRKKAIHASLESIRETIQANSGGNKDKARDILRKVKDWGLGKHKNKASNPKGNAKKDLGSWAMSWDNFPMSYRRIMNDNMETLTPARQEAMMVVADAMGAYFKVCGMTPQSVLDCTGESAWQG